MSQRERQASGGVTEALRRPAAAPPSAPAPETANGRAPPWEEIYCNASPAQQGELLALARRQGLLYGHQLPGFSNGASDRSRQLLSRLLGGQTEELEPACPGTVEVLDPALDSGQRAAVAKALLTPDVFLLQGLPGTGKSRVVAEIITQAAVGGERVLLLAPTAAALDRVLEQVGEREAVCAVRCLGRDERPDTLAPVVRGLTFAERSRRLSDQALRSARQAALAADQRVLLRQREGVLWTRLLEVADRRQHLEQQAELLRQRRDESPAAVERAAAELEVRTWSPDAEPFGFPSPSPAPSYRTSNGGSFADALGALLRVRHAERANHVTALAELSRKKEIWDRTEAELLPRLEALRPLAEAKQQGRWWTGLWWRATLGRHAVADYAELEASHQQARAALAELEQQAHRCLQEQQDADCGFAAERSRLVAAEVDRCRAGLEGQAAALRQEQASLEETWQTLCSQLDPAGRLQAAVTPDAARAAFHAYRLEADREEERRAFAHQWVACLEQNPGTLALRLPDFANVVAATTTALPADEHFGDSAGPGRKDFDLLVLEEADQVTESEFLKVARRARRWVLVGEPDSADRYSGIATGQASGEAHKLKGDPGKTRSTISVSRSLHTLRPGFFRRLWSHLHCELWVQDGDRLRYQRRPLVPEQQPWVESERVADFPDIELRILSLPQAPPQLVEVVFPPSMSIYQAKEYIYRQLEELPMWAPGRNVCWVEEADRLVLRLADQPRADVVPVPLEPGVREMVVATVPGARGGPSRPAPWSTCGIEFDRQAGWDRRRAEDWVQEHQGVSDLGRTTCLDVPYRMHRDLAAFLSDLLFGGAYRSEGAAGRAEGPTTVEFLSVPPCDSRSRLRDARGGAGLEVDLVDLRHRDRLPTEARAVLPERGLVNYLEAQAVIRTLERLAAEPLLRDSTGAGRPRIAVLSLFPTQVQLLRHLIRQAPTLAAAGLDVEVDVPSAFRQRECAVVVLSLTRSHSHRAVAYGEDPETLALALTRARDRLILVGDPGTLARRSHWEGALDHLNEASAGREREILSHLVRYLQGQGSHPHTFRWREGSGPS